MGLVQLFRDSPFPGVIARQLLELALEDFRETGHHYLLYLVMSRGMARRHGTTQEVEAFDDQINEYAIHEQFPRHWHLDYMFSKAGYDTYGDGLVPFWAAVLIQICTLEQQWEGVLSGTGARIRTSCPASTPTRRCRPPPRVGRPSAYLGSGAPRCLPPAWPLPPLIGACRLSNRPAARWSASTSRRWRA